MTESPSVLVRSIRALAGHKSWIAEECERLNEELCKARDGINRLTEEYGERSTALKVRIPTAELDNESLRRELKLLHARLIDVEGRYTRELCRFRSFAADWTIILETALCSLYT